MKKEDRIVILGGGFGGIVTAIRAAKKSPKTEILVIDQNNFHVYTPWLYESVTGGLEERGAKIRDKFGESGGVPMREIFSQYKNIKFRKATVIGCDFDGNQIQLEGGRAVKYGKLVLALGSSPAFFGIKDVEKYGLLLRDKESAIKLRKSLQQVLQKEGAHIVVAGAGAAGVEMVAELANFVRKHKYRVDISLVEASEHVLNRFQKHIIHYSERRLKKLGVQLHLNSPVSKVTATTVGIRREGGVESMPYDLFIWTGGIQPAQILKQFDLPKDTRGRIRVLPTLQVEGHPNVYGVGDVISYKDLKNGNIAPPAAWAAIEEAKILGHNLVRERKKLLKMPKRYPAVVNVGGRKAVGSFSIFPIFGFLGFIVRRIVDLNYWRKLLPWHKALSFWWGRVWLFGKND